MGFTAPSRANEDPYKVLGVPTTSDFDSIKKRYKLLVYQVHPDRFPMSQFEEASQRLSRINVAFGEIKRKYAESPESFNPSSTENRQGPAATTKPPPGEQRDMDGWSQVWGQDMAAGYASAHKQMNQEEDARYKADAILTKVYPGIAKLKTSTAGGDAPYYDKIRWELGRLIEFYEFHRFRSSRPDADPVSHLARAIFNGYSIGWTPDIVRGSYRYALTTFLSFMGPDPVMRENHFRLLKTYDPKSVIQANEVPRLALAAFIYHYWWNIQYVPKQSGGVVAPGQKISAGWGSITAVELAKLVLPFTEFSRMRTEFLLNLLPNAGSAHEFIQIAMVYLLEESAQYRDWPSDKLPRSPSESMNWVWGNLRRAVDLRGEDLGIESFEHLLYAFFTAHEQPDKDLEFFRRLDDGVQEWAYEKAMQKINEWLPKLDLETQLKVTAKLKGQTDHRAPQIVANSIERLHNDLASVPMDEQMKLIQSSSSDLTNDPKIVDGFLGRLDSYLEQNPSKRLPTRAWAEKLDPQLKDRVLRTLQQHGASGHLPAALCKTGLVTPEAK